MLLPPSMGIPGPQLLFDTIVLAIVVGLLIPMAIPRPNWSPLNRKVLLVMVVCVTSTKTPTAPPKKSELLNMNVLFAISAPDRKCLWPHLSRPCWQRTCCW